MRVLDDGSIEASPDEVNELHALSVGDPAALRRLVRDQIAVIETLESALGLIAREGCRNFTSGPGSCVRVRPEGRGHRYGAEAWCDACVAFDALEKTRSS